MNPGLIRRRVPFSRRGWVRAALVGVAAVALCGGRTAGAAEVVDRIVAVVGHHIILQSELEGQLAMTAAQEQVDLSMPGVRKEMESALLEQMVSDRLMLIQAERDTLAHVTDREVESELDKHMDRIQSQFSSPEEFYKQLATEGLTLPELRRRYRSEVKNQLLKQKLIESKLRSVDISAPEVESFFHKFRDSLPPQPAAVELADIVLDVAVSQTTLDSVKRVAAAVLDSLQKGADFAEMAARHSGDATATAGGDLGWFGRGVMVPDFEKAAFGLPVGQISGLVTTRFGIHILKSLERRGDRVHAAHILFRTLPSEADMARVRARADSLRKATEDGADFGALAKTYSTDSVTAAQGGSLGWIALEALQEPFKSAVGGKEAGALLDPVMTDDGMHLLKIVDRRAQRPFELAEDRAAITEMARREKTGRVVEQWVQELRDQIYVEVRL
jgi:peptidyl-prolyl cis-trans isomerase SurA